MRNSFLSKLMQASLICCLALFFTGCDDLFGEWDKPTPVTPSETPAEKTAAKITVAPTVTPGDIVAGSTTALVTAGTAMGGTMSYAVTTTNTKPTTTGGFSATVPTAAALAAGTYYVWYYAKADADHKDSEISATAITVTVLPNPLATPLTLEATTDGTIIIETPRVGMKYKKNDDDLVTISSTSDVTISVATGDKVAFYGDGTNITSYYASDYDYTSISGGTAKVKAYGNIMSLVDEENFATATALTASSAFHYLFFSNSSLIDASDLLLPATTLTDKCYYGMFTFCTAMTAGPKKLPAENLANSCYETMFFLCNGMTSAPVLPAKTLAPMCYFQMFAMCSSLSSVTCLATDISATVCTGGWLFGAATTGTLTKAAGATCWDGKTDDSGTNGWTVVDYVEP